VKRPDGTKEETAMFKFRLPPSLIEDLKELATRDSRTLSALLRKIAEDYVKAAVPPVTPRPQTPPPEMKNEGGE
jgi:hypothetical protein